MKKAPVLIVLLVSIVLSLLLYSDYEKNKKLNAGLEERKQKDALGMLIAATGGQHPYINESLRGKTVVLNVWASWCGPCLMEIPELNMLAAEFKSDKVAFIALNELPVIDETQKMLALGVTFDYQLSFSDEALINTLYTFLLPHEVQAIPLNAVINPQGKIELLYTGNDATKLKEMRDYLARNK